VKAVGVTEDDGKKEQNNEKRAVSQSDVDVDNKLKPPLENSEAKHEPKQTNGPLSNFEESGTIILNNCVRDWSTRITFKGCKT
jgi:hypothetical protein